MKNVKQVFALLILCCTGFTSQAQTLRTYLESYYQYDFSKPTDDYRPNFIYNHSRNNEIGLNLALLHFSDERVRTRYALGLMTGSYVEMNLRAEPPVMRMLNEGYVGFDLSKKGKGVWMDVGIFSSHIGFESIIGSDCPTLTRSILADNSPYYESGLRIGKKWDNGWSATGLILNGWQTMHKPAPQTLPALGYQIQYTKGKWAFNSSAYAGRIPYQKRMRYFHNFWMKYDNRNRFTVTLGFDDGFQEKIFARNKYDYWNAGVLIVTYPVTPKWTLAARGEYYLDPKGVMIYNAPQLGSASLGLNCIVMTNLKCRIEGRWLNSNKQQFNTSSGIYGRTNYCVTGAITYSLTTELGRRFLKQQEVEVAQNP